MAAEDGLDFLGGQSGEAQNAGGRHAQQGEMSQWMFAAAATPPPSARWRDSSEGTAGCNMEQVSFFSTEMEPDV